MEIKLTNSFKRRAKESALRHQPAILNESKNITHIWRDGHVDGYIRGFLEAKAETIPTTIDEVEAEEKRQMSADLCGNE